MCEGEVGNPVGPCDTTHTVNLQIIEGYQPSDTDDVVEEIRPTNRVAVSNFKTDHDLPSGWAQRDEDNIRVRVFDRGGGSQVQIEMLKADRSSFSPPRRQSYTLTAAGRRGFKMTRCLRLVADSVDKQSRDAQTILAGLDPADASVEILGQIMRVTYTCSRGRQHQLDALVGKRDTRNIKIALHVVQSSSAPDPAAVRTLMLQRLRQAFAQVHLSVRLRTADATTVTPRANLLSVAEPLGQAAAGGQIAVELRRGGRTTTVTHATTAGDTPEQTVQGLARRLGRVQTFRNPVAHGGTDSSWDIKIPGRNVTLVSASSTDSNHTVQIASADDQRTLPAIPSSSVLMGSVAHRALCRNHALDDHVNIFVVDNIQNTGTVVTNGQALMRGSYLDAQHQGQPPVCGSAFLVRTSMVEGGGGPETAEEEAPALGSGMAGVQQHGGVASFSYPFNCAHEIGHLLLDTGHVQPSVSRQQYQLMRGGDGSGSNTVGAAKRLAGYPVRFNLLGFGQARSAAVDHELRMRSQHPGWLE